MRKSILHAYYKIKSIKCDSEIEINRQTLPSPPNSETKVRFSYFALIFVCVICSICQFMIYHHHYVVMISFTCARIKMDRFSKKHFLKFLIYSIAWIFHLTFTHVFNQPGHRKSKGKKSNIAGAELCQFEFAAAKREIIGIKCIRRNISKR